MKIKFIPIKRDYKREKDLIYETNTIRQSNKEYIFRDIKTDTVKKVKKTAYVMEKIIE